MTTYQMRPRGERHYKSKLTEEDVRLIRELHKAKQDLYQEIQDRRAEIKQLREQALSLSTNSIAEKFGVRASTVSRILYENAWAHVK